MNQKCSILEKIFFFFLPFICLVVPEMEVFAVDPDWGHHVVISGWEDKRPVPYTTKQTGYGGIVIDSNDNDRPDDDDYRWIMYYNPSSSLDHNAIIYQQKPPQARAVEPNVTRTFQLNVLNINGPIVAEEERWHTHGTKVTVSREGTPNLIGYNTVDFTDFFDGNSICKLNFYDTTGDGIADEIGGFGDVKGGPQVCLSDDGYTLSRSAIENHDGVNYFVIDLSTLIGEWKFDAPELHRYKELGDQPIPFTKVFIPVVVPASTSETPYVTIESNGTRWGGTDARITPAKPSPTRIPCEPAIPTVDEYGAALIMLLLLACGIWIMRKRGFGDKMAF